MSEIEEILQRYKEVRARLRNPPNAVPDTGINLRRGRATTPSEEPPSISTLSPPSEARTENPSLSLTYIEPLKLSGLTFSSTLAAAAVEFGITPKEIRARSRKKRVSLPRQVAIYIATKNYNRSYTWIGRYLNLDHTTIIYARKKIGKLIKEDPKFCDKVKSIEEKVALLSTFTVSPDCQSYLEEGAEGNVPLGRVPELDQRSGSISSDSKEGSYQDVDGGVCSNTGTMDD